MMLVNFLRLKCFQLAILLIHFSGCFSATLLFEGDECIVQNKTGICTLESKCTIITDNLKSGKMKVDDVVGCGFGVNEEILCCPVPEIVAHYNPDSIGERPAAAACKKIREGLSYIPVPQILHGTEVNRFEYPFMVALGYPSSNNDSYDFRCGGALIESKFVLTAAHCIRRIPPVVVRLGITNLLDEKEIKNMIQIKIKTPHIHPDYFRKYNDIAVLELETPIPTPYLPHARPTCISTDLNDPPEGAQLFVAGWGEISKQNRKTSNILLKAQLDYVPINECNSSYAMGGKFPHQLEQGLSDSHLCAFDPGLQKDACQGDSGGPLIWVIDESKGDYCIVGVIQAGFGCADKTPGLYARVATHLKFIENIVWPSK